MKRIDLACVTIICIHEANQSPIVPSKTKMTDFFSSALNYFSGGSEESGGNRFVGQTVEVGEGNKLRIKKVIAEGELVQLGRYQ